ncbi:nucleotide sugar dehydrogenase [Roseiconus nitratireducens]|nr:nucleotide sugar dehydrogenase [Roseiconus nitratireducens]
MRIAVVGMGYVGCVTATCLARDGNQVIGVDIDPRKVDSINAGISPVFEPGLEDLLRSQVDAGRLRGTTDIAEAVAESELALVAVGTPSADDGSVNYQTVLRVIEQLGRCLQASVNPYTIVVRSTLLPGVLEDVLQPALEEATGAAVGERIQLCNNPEFLRETTAIRDYDQPPFVLVGANSDAAAATAMGLYSDLDCQKIVTSTRAAAMVKYTSNAYHALKISFANEIGALAKAFGTDGQEVMRIVCEDTQLNVSKAYLRPGFAFGGSCLPKDVRALVRHAEQQGQRCEVMQGILASNQTHLQRALKLVRENGARRIGLVGLSFKAGTDDLRESPQVILAQTLLGEGYELLIFDPDVRVTALVGANRHYIDEQLPHLARLLCDDAQQMLDESELLIVATGAVERFGDLDRFQGQVIDLRRDLVAGEESLPKSDFVPTH